VHLCAKIQTVLNQLDKDMRALYKVFCFSLFCTFLLLTGCDSRAKIVNNLVEREANEIVVLLVSRGIGAEKEEAPATSTGGGGGVVHWNITVPAHQITDAISVLNSSGLPRTRGTTLLDLFGEQGLVPSEMQDRVRYQEGLSEQLANTIRMMDGIVDASVQITFPQGDDEEHRKNLTASVLVKHRGILDNPNSLTVTKIKRLVASSLPGLEVENVTVIPDRSLTSDITLQQLQLAEDLEYVSIWGIVIAKVSAGSFQILLYILLTIIFFFALALIWICWKFSPFLLHNEGYKQLITLAPIAFNKQPAKSAAAESASLDSSFEDDSSIEEEEEEFEP
jgi:type III secretion protein J